MRKRTASRSESDEPHVVQHSAATRTEPTATYSPRSHPPSSVAVTLLEAVRVHIRDELVDLVRLDRARRLREIFILGLAVVVV